MLEEFKQESEEKVIKIYRSIDKYNVCEIVKETRKSNEFYQILLKNL